MAWIHTDVGAQHGLGLGQNEVVLCRKVPLSEGRVEEGELQVRANERTRYLCQQESRTEKVQE